MHVYAYFVNVTITFFVNYSIPDKYIISYNVFNVTITSLYNNFLSVPDKTMRYFRDLLRKVECTFSAHCQIVHALQLKGCI